MSLVVVVLLAALALGWLLGGSVRRLGTLELRGGALVAAALAVQVAGSLAGGALHAAGLVASAGLVSAFLLRNRGLAGVGLVALGLLGNAAVVAANGAMPVSERAAARVGAPVGAALDGSDPRHERETGDTRLRLLGDVVPVALPVLPQVVSPGDVLVAAGLGRLVVLGMGGRLGTGAGSRERARGGTVRPRPSHTRR